LSLTSRIRFLYLFYISKPISDRSIYRAIWRRRIQRIVEIGVGTGQRAARMIEVATLNAAVGDVCYTGVDLFEARPEAAGPNLTLRAAYRLLRPTGARLRLVPGDPFAALSRAANTLTGTELVVISAGHDPDALARAWFYLPRMLGRHCLVLIEKPGEPEGELALRSIARDEIERLARNATLRRAA
jgi:hypothetical protein